MSELMEVWGGVWGMVSRWGDTERHVGGARGTTDHDSVLGSGDSKKSPTWKAVSGVVVLLRMVSLAARSVDHL